MKSAMSAVRRDLSVQEGGCFPEKASDQEKQNSKCGKDSRVDKKYTHEKSSSHADVNDLSAPEERNGIDKKTGRHDERSKCSGIENIQKSR